MLPSSRLAILVVSTLLSSAGVLVVACSTDNGTTPLPGQGDSGGRPRTDGTSGGTSGGNNSSGGEDDDAGSRDAGADCGSPRTPRSNPGVYCRKNATDVDDDGYCTIDDKTICCSDARQSSGGFLPGKCVSNGADCAFPAGSGGREWHCTESDHCDGQACCVIKGDAGGPKVFTDRCGERNNNSDIAFVGGSRCKSSCAADELRLCAKDEDCDNGKTCHFFDIANRFTGVCE